MTCSSWVNVTLYPGIASELIFFRVLGGKKKRWALVVEELWGGDLDTFLIPRENTFDSKERACVNCCKLLQTSLSQILVPVCEASLRRRERSVQMVCLASRMHCPRVEGLKRPTCVTRSFTFVKHWCVSELGVFFYGCGGCWTIRVLCIKIFGYTCQNFKSCLG